MRRVRAPGHRRRKIVGPPPLAGGVHPSYDLGRSTAPEAAFLGRLFTGKLRRGALAG